MSFFISLFETSYILAWNSANLAMMAKRSVMKGCTSL